MFYFEYYPHMYLWLIPLAIWAGVWKGVGLWKAGRNNQVGWFVVMFILNTAGILPIVYIVFFQKRPKVMAAKRKPRKKRR